MTDFIRQRALDYRLRQTPLEKERVRQLARIGANLNQLARWANKHKGRAEAVQVLAALPSFERTLKEEAPPAPGILKPPNTRGCAMCMKVFPHGQGDGEGPIPHSGAEIEPDAGYTFASDSAHFHEKVS